MAKSCKGFNSKCFLITYLIIVGFLLVLWMNRLPLMHQDEREIPAEMQSYLASPPRPLPAINLATQHKLALTNDWFGDKWTFVYFTHGNCMPSCYEALKSMDQLQAAFANKDFQFLVVGIDSADTTAIKLTELMDSQQLDFMAASASTDTIEKLAKVFIALFLKTEFSDGSYQIEQEHHIFVVDPKGRVYATFMPPYSGASIQAAFLKLRHFYAQTE